MYLRKSSRTYKGRTYSNYLLVESVLTPQGPRQKIICSLGDLSPRPKQEWLALARKLEALEKKYDAQFKVVFDAIRQLMAPPPPSRKKIGFQFRERRIIYGKK